MEETIHIAYSTQEAAEDAARSYAAQGFEVKGVDPAIDGSGWVVEAFRPDVEGDGLWTAARLTTFREGD